MIRRASNIDEFINDVQKFSDDVPNQLLTYHKKISIEALRGVVMKTPVDTGEARGNWQLTTTAEPAERTIDRKDKSGGQTISQEASRLGTLKPFGVVSIANNAEHIAVLENGGFVPENPGPSKDKRKGRKGKTLVKGGYSVQAPNGMVKVTVEEIESHYK